MHCVLPLIVPLKGWIIAYSLTYISCVSQTNHAFARKLSTTSGGGGSGQAGEAYMILQIQ